MLTAFGLISTALKEVAFGLDAFSSVKVEFLTTFTAEEVSCILVHLDRGVCALQSAVAPYRIVFG